MRKKYWWLVVPDPETGRTNLIFGSDKNEDEAREKGLEMLGGLDFDVKMYPTRNRNEASAFHRGKRLEDGEGLKRSSQRLGHEKTLNRIMKRRNPSEW